MKINGKFVDVGDTINDLQKQVESLTGVLDRITKALDRDPTHTTLEQRLTSSGFATRAEDAFEFSVAENHFDEIKV